MKNVNKVILILCAICINSYVRAQKSKPNIIVIVADDLGYSTPGVYAGTASRCKTPNINQIARDGAVFNNAYVTASVCGPSRSGLLTGKYQQRFGVYANIDCQ